MGKIIIIKLLNHYVNLVNRKKKENEELSITSKKYLAHYICNFKIQSLPS